MTAPLPADEGALRRFEDAWRSGRPRPLEQFLPPADHAAYPETLVALVWLELELAWEGRKRQGQETASVGRPPLLEDYLGRFPQLGQPPLLLRMMQREYLVRHLNGDHPTPADYGRRFPDCLFEEQDVRALLSTADEAPGTAPAPAAPASSPGTPASLGRYRILGQLGAGTFGAVYRGYDDDLRREVAIKVARAGRPLTPADVQAYLDEARVLAELDHPGIVPVYDVGHTPDGLWYVVSKLVAGQDLAALLRSGAPPRAKGVGIVAAVAEALHHAHRRGVVHRDVKPANILLDDQGRPVVVDFGLALREEDFGKGSGFAGTPAYMSPEQARKESHRVDARTDVYSLGVVLYQLLTGRLPVAGGDLNEVLEAVKTREPQPPRQVDDTIPRELDRICLKALAKRSSDRYSTALDLAEDLRHWQQQSSPTLPASVPAPRTEAPPVPAASVPAGPVKVLPKGLRSFDALDADFFLELLPGPHDRNGLPDTVRFWKVRIEATDPEQAFSVGLLYGPSGCGKSSFVRAGLLPRLARHILPVYVEATADDTEVRLLARLRQRCPGLPLDLSLADAFAHLRRGEGLAAGAKVLVVLDQFEQWLHAHPEEESGELVQALRQCDGRHLQCLILVRDDFWMATTRFMRALEVRVVEGTNAAAVDLFDLRHARKVLAGFGQAFGALPEGQTTVEQEHFLDQAVRGLAQAGKVIPVRLSLFGEMVKGGPWAPATLKEMGGAEGIGVAFLEETFSARTAPPEHRLHQKAARAVLAALLPEVGSDLKGHMRSRQDLLEASGYGRRPEAFTELLRILDGELRLVTPTDPEGRLADEEAPAGSVPRGQYYQLTHDYLVPALRQWLTRKQRETVRGRSELRLAERAAEWGARRQKRHLLAWWELLPVVLFTRRARWSAAEQAIIRAAARYHLTWAGVVCVLLVLGSLAIAEWVTYEQTRRTAEALAGTMTSAKPPELLNAVPSDIPRRYRWVVEARLEKVFRARNQQQPDSWPEYWNVPIMLVLMDFDLDDDKVGILSRWLLEVGSGEEVTLREEGSVCSKLLPKLRQRYPGLVIPIVEKKLKERPGEGLGEDAQARQQANAAVVLFCLGRDDLVWPWLGPNCDPHVRAYLIRRLGLMGADEQTLLKELPAPGLDAATTRSLLLSLVEYDKAQPTLDPPVLQQVLKLYQSHPDPGVHSAAERLLRAWDQGELIGAIEPTLVGGWSEEKRRWYVTATGHHTLAVVPRDNPLGYRFAIATKEVTETQFLAFDPQHQYPSEAEHTPDKNIPYPAAHLNWHRATAYCNWLSEKEGLEPFYKEPEKEAHEATDPRRGPGYRLASVGEWEYACRVGVKDHWYYGSSAEILSQYAWSLADARGQLHPVGEKKPNDLGLFDMLGNVREWCHDGGTRAGYKGRLGGSVRSSLDEFKDKIPEDQDDPSHPADVVGFRIARTLPD